MDGRPRLGVGVIHLVEIYYRVYQWKSAESRSVCDEVMKLLNLVTDCRAIFVTKTKTRIIALRSMSTTTRIVTTYETKTI